MRVVTIVLVAIFVSSMAAQVDARPSKRDRRRAKRISRKALKKYQEGEKEEAARLFLRAYDLSHHPVQLRNAARALEETEALEESKRLWQQLLTHDGVTPDERREAEAHVDLIDEKIRRAETARVAEEARAAAERAELEARAAKKAADTAAMNASLARSSAEREVEPTQVYGAWGVLGGGGLLLGSSLTVFLVSDRRASRLDDRIAIRDGQGRIAGISAVEVQAEVDQINRERLASRVLLGVGLAVAVTGVLWWVLEANGWWPFGG